MQQGYSTAADTFRGLFARRRHNAQTTAGKLPFELLARIFRLCASNDLVDPWPSPGEKVLVSAITISHVSLRWRVYALETCELWSQLRSALGPRWLEEMLVRAHSTPLSLFLEDDCSCPETMQTQMDHLLSHLRHISLHGSPTIRRPQLQSFVRLLSAPTPMLESLEIIHTFEGYTAVFVPVEPFAGGAPNLRRLVVDGDRIVLPGRVQVMENLTYYEFRDRGTNGYASNEQLRVMLEHMPNLQVLILERSWTYELEFLPTTKPRLSLQYLTDFSIRGAGSYLACVLSQLKISPTTNVKVTCIRAIEKDKDRLCAVLRTVVEDWSGNATSLAARVAFCRHSNTPAADYDVWELKRCYSEGGCGDAAWASTQEQTRFEVHTLARYNVLKNILLSSVLTPCGLRALAMYCSDDDRGHRPKWQTLFTGCGTVEHLCIAAPDWLGRLLREWRTDGSLFRNLKTLWIRGVDLTSSIDVPGPVVHRAPEQWTPKMVLERLIAQQGSAFPLDALCFVDSAVPGGWFKELSRVVAVRLVEGDSQIPSYLQ
ncbi:hypothetical protein DENSPDRAFT_401624 [Dentipellis sp. KUC8613]|nr:hypothetical protein DENSPDRAFT_401624 [Dentipellis sp. KUC8613]